MNAFPGIVVNDGREKFLIHTFKQKFVDETLLPQRILFWNSFQYNPQRLTLDDAKQLSLYDAHDLFFYNERNKKIYTVVDYSSLIRYMENLEPWEEVDGILFDKELNWVLAFTHEDVLLAVGLDHVK